MTRVAPWLALVISILALVCASLANRRSAGASAEAPAAPGSPAAVPASAAAGPAAASGLSGGDAASIAAELIARRESEIVDRIWPKIVRMRDGSGLSVPAKPTKVDDALVYLLDIGDEGDEAADGRPPELKKQVTQCKNDLKQLGIYFCLYESKFRVYPAAIEDVRRPDMMTAESTILNCPFDKSGDACSYEYLYPIRGDEQPYDSIMAYDKHLHPDGKRCVLYFQGRVDEVADGDFQKVLGEQIAGDRAILGDEVVKARTLALDPALTGPQKEAAQKRLNDLERVQR